MIASQIIDLWKGIGTPTSAQDFEAILSPPQKKLAGFHLRNGEYPIFPPDTLQQKELLVLGEPEIKEVYISLGGNREKADKMFPVEETN